MKHTPEPSLLPPEHPLPPLRCSLCLQTGRELLDLPFGTVCHPCLHRSTMDQLSALLCAPIITEET